MQTSQQQLWWLFFLLLLLLLLTKQDCLASERSWAGARAAAKAVHEQNLLALDLGQESQQHARGNADMLHALDGAAMLTRSTHGAAGLLHQHLSASVAEVDTSAAAEAAEAALMPAVAAQTCNCVVSAEAQFPAVEAVDTTTAVPEQRAVAENGAADTLLDKQQEQSQKHQRQERQEQQRHGWSYLWFVVNGLCFISGWLITRWSSRQPVGPGQEAAPAAAAPAAAAVAAT